LHFYLARSYQVYKEDGRAGDTFHIAAQNEQDKKQKLSFLSDAAVAYGRSKDVHKKNLSIEELKIGSIGIEGGDAILVDALRQIGDIENDKESYFAYSEYLLDLRPGDNDLRFKLAYEYSQQNRSELSLYHYMKIPHSERSPVAWNNIGVADARLDMHSLAVDAYRKAEELGETLAMSNLALKLMAAGFLKEATEICDRAIQIKDYHKNVGDTIYRIKKAQEEEAEKQQKTFNDVKPYSEFYRDYGRAAAKAALAEEHGIWQGPKCKLNVTVIKDQFRAEGTYEVPEFGLGLSAFLLPGTTQTGQPKSVTHTFKIDGVISGHAIKARISEGKEGEVPTLLTGFLNTRDALMILSEDRKEIRVYEKDPPNVGKFYSMTRLQ
jgi:tetratricopeptide (TPR) repeat protein